MSADPLHKAIAGSQDGPDFNQEVNLHADEIARRHDSKIEQEKEEMSTPSAQGELDLLPGLKKALELCQQARAYHEMTARPLTASHEWAVEVRIRGEIVRIESKTAIVKPSARGPIMDMHE